MRMSPVSTQGLCLAILMPLLLCLNTGMATKAVAGGLPAANYAEIVISRNDDSQLTDPFLAEIFVTLGLETGVTGVTVTIGNGTPLDLTDVCSCGEWEFEGELVSIADLISVSNGTWTIEVFGSSPSTSTFTVNSLSYVDGDFFATPTGLSPADGEHCVLPDAAFTWNDPTGGTADVMGVDMCDTLDSQDDDSVFGSMLVTDTTWTPPAIMEEGPAEFDVWYLNFDPDSRVGPLNVTSGTIVWSNSPFAPLGYPAKTPLLVNGSITVSYFGVLDPGASASVWLFRENIGGLATTFLTGIEVNLGTVPGVTGVNVTFGDGVTTVPLVDLGDGSWDSLDQHVATYADMITLTNGFWTIDVLGLSTSTSTFSIDTASFVEPDFFGTPAGLVPAHGATGVATDASFSWIEPAGAFPDVIGINVWEDLGTYDEGDDSVLGTMTVNDLAWTPPVEMGGGVHEWEIIYANFDTAVRASSYTVTVGTIEWTNPCLAPVDYVLMTPLLIYGSVSGASFTVIAAIPCPADSDDSGTVDVLDLLDLLAKWGSCPAPCPEDNDDSETVDVLDLLALLAAWGPCS